MWFGRKTSEAQLNSELRYHFEKLVCDFAAAGIPPEQARRRARLEFGGVEQIKEECRDVRGRWLEDLGRRRCKREKAKMVGAGLTELGRSGESEQSCHERDLPRDVVLWQPPYLSLPDHIHRLDALNRARR